MSHRIRILIIDDDPMFRSLLLSLLRKDYLVSVAGDGRDGYYKALQHHPDVAIVDIQMPGWDGLKTLKAFRKHPAMSEIPVMMLTSDASRETVLAAIEAGANDYMIKTSFSKEDLHQKLDKLVVGTPPPLTNDPAERTSTANPGGGDLSGPTFDSDLMPKPVPAVPIGVDAADEDDATLQEMIDDWE